MKPITASEIAARREAMNERYPAFGAFGDEVVRAGTSALLKALADDAAHGDAVRAIYEAMREAEKPSMANDYAQWLGLPARKP